MSDAIRLLFSISLITKAIDNMNSNNIMAKFVAICFFFIFLSYCPCPKEYPGLPSNSYKFSVFITDTDVPAVKKAVVAVWLTFYIKP